MGKRRSNDRQKLAGRIGLSKVRYCRDHDELVKPVKIFGKGMVWQCKKGCSLDQSVTVLKVPKI
jgi:hypothetical protein